MVWRIGRWTTPVTGIRPSTGNMHTVTGRAAATAARLCSTRVGPGIDKTWTRRQQERTKHNFILGLLRRCRGAGIARAGGEHGGRVRGVEENQACGRVGEQPRQNIGIFYIHANRKLCFHSSQQRFRRPARGESRVLKIDRRQHVVAVNYLPESICRDPALGAWAISTHRQAAAATQTTASQPACQPASQPASLTDYRTSLVDNSTPFPPRRFDCHSLSLSLLLPPRSLTASSPLPPIVRVLDLDLDLTTTHSSSSSPSSSSSTLRQPPNELRLRHCPPIARSGQTRHPNQTAPTPERQSDPSAF
ncbi:hypothetical protein JOL62DRAFT_138039 [Phyllosticta paracitricarpa]|uniref:Uncharacterized protein n=1 Tax=Phyllosticta paracitricarpa TaxID=2016321 RepID=A0ABR1NL32_9PEZI